MVKRKRQRQGADRRLLAVIAVIGILAIAVPVLPYTGVLPAATGPGPGSGPGSTLPGRAVPDQGRDHVLPGQPHPPYNTTPPTSGWHYPSTADWGIHTEPIPDELQVHNLEHGGILIQYNCQCPDLVEKLAAIVKRYPSHVILAPYPKMPYRIALTAWTRIDTLDDFDEARIVRFIEAYRMRGPENAP
jgi:hypothetical protein